MDNKTNGMHEYQRLYLKIFYGDILSRYKEMYKDAKRFYETHPKYMCEEIANGLASTKNTLLSLGFTEDDLISLN